MWFALAGCCPGACSSKPGPVIWSPGRPRGPRLGAAPSGRGSGAGTPAEQPSPGPEDASIEPTTLHASPRALAWSAPYPVPGSRDGHGDRRPPSDANLGAEMGPAEFRDGDPVIGWILLGFGGTGLLGAFVIGRETDVIRRRTAGRSHGESVGLHLPVVARRPVRSSSWWEASMRSAVRCAWASPPGEATAPAEGPAVGWPSIPPIWPGPRSGFTWTRSRDSTASAIQQLRGSRRRSGTRGPRPGSRRWRPVHGPATRRSAPRRCTPRTAR